MTEAQQALHTALEEGQPVTLSLATLRPRTLLEWLAASDGAARMTIEDREGQIVVEVSNGLVVGATAETRDGALTGQPAYERLRHVREGSAHVEPLRFPSLANILVPVTELPAFHSVRPEPPSAAPDTVVIPLPAARPVHVPDPTMELELPPELVCAPTLVGTPETAPRWDTDEPTIDAAMDVLTELEAESEAPPRAESPRAESLEQGAAKAPTAEVVVPASPARVRSRARSWWAAAAVLVLCVGAGGAALYLSSSSEAATVATDEAGTDEPDMSFDLDEVPDGDTSGDTDTRDEARALARLARRQLRAGQATRALANARRAAALRRHLPYYQVLLGDALRANGQRRAARRAYRRALRMRPDYGPAQRRLGRSATLASRMATSDRG